MKKSFMLLTSVLLAGFFASASFPKLGLHLASLEWSTTELTLGDIPQGIPAEAVFTVENIGNAPFQILEVKTSCGCTASEWTKDPIAPGASATIVATYNAAKEGFFRKTIRVKTNTATTETVLIISGTVVAAE